MVHHDEFQYYQVPLLTFLKECMVDEDPKSKKPASTQKPPTGGLSKKSGVPGVLCFALNALLGNSSSRFKVVPRAADAPVYTPRVALFTRPESVSAKNAWAWMISPVEIVDGASAGGFHFSLPDRSVQDAPKDSLFLVDTPEGQNARRDLEECISEVLLHQHRTHIYMLHVAQDFARISRWDRAGCIVSEPVDLSTRLFEGVVSRLANLSAKAQGFDEHVKLATPADVQKLKNYSPDNVYLREYRDAILNSAEEYPIYEISCPMVNRALYKALAMLKNFMPSMPRGSFDDEDYDEPRRFQLPFDLDQSRPMKKYLIGRPKTHRRPLAGRCTVGYIAYNIDNNRLSFLKDQWRCTDAARTELDNYEDLMSRGVEGIATIEAGGDVRQHRTLSQQIMNGMPYSAKSVGRTHVRIVERNVGRSLDTVTEGKDLLRYVMEAVLAHQFAWSNGGILHCDISDGNVLIDVETNKGFLNDWDIAERRSTVVGRWEGSGFTGTWPFGSALSLQYPRKPHDAEDDTEAFIWLVVFIAIQRLEHDLSAEQQAALVDSLFYEHKVAADGTSIGGMTKLHYIRLGTPPIQLKNRADPVAIFLNGAFKLMHDVYAKIDYEAIRHWRGEPRSANAYMPRRGVSILEGINNLALDGLMFGATDGWKDYVRERELEEKNHPKAARDPSARLATFESLLEMLGPGVKERFTSEEETAGMPPLD